MKGWPAGTVATEPVPFRSTALTKKPAEGAAVGLAMGIAVRVGVKVGVGVGVAEVNAPVDTSTMSFGEETT